ncbi:iron sulfur cluster assembly protein-like protein 1 [Aureobasidium pullulans]|uniref:Iron-sulfur cluster assembly protein n=1 Tax=Aureobasidium pullulans TaxID=5580 RepID=A0A4S9X311_AURPU|nr:iron sulfur cluster assembly protein-like protein 1 [Aureobasidium pullulans]
MFRRIASTVPAQASRAMTAAVRPSIAPSFRAAAPAISAALLDHYSKPRNVGSMQKGDTDVGTGLVGAPACGDVMKLQIRVDPNDNTISEVKFKTFGCGSAIASSSYLTELVKGMTLEQAGRIKNTEIAKELCLPPVKLHCSMLAEDAIKSAISNYYTKNPNARKTDLGGTSAPLPKVEVETVSASA